MGEACLLKARPSRRYCTYWRSGKCHNLSQGSKCNEFSSRALHHFTSIVEYSFLLYHRRVALILVACMHWASLPFFSCYRVSRENSKSLFFFPTLYIHTYTVTGHTYTHSCPQHWRFGTQPGDVICFTGLVWARSLALMVALLLLLLALRLLS